MTDYTYQYRITGRVEVTEIFDGEIRKRTLNHAADWGDTENIMLHVYGGNRDTDQCIEVLNMSAPTFVSVKWLDIATGTRAIWGRNDNRYVVCVLKEGTMAIDVDDGITTWSFSDSIEIDCLVELATDEHSITHSRKTGCIIVQKYTGGAVLGACSGDPKLMNLPSAGIVDNWGEMVKNEIYRTCVIDTGAGIPMRA